MEQLKAELSAHGRQVKGYYDSGRWSLERVRNVTIKGYITPEEFKIITGEEWV